MENNDYTNISKDDYDKIISIIELGNIDEDELIEIHKGLIGKTCNHYNIKDCGVAFVNRLLSRDWGRSVIYQYSEGAKKFIQSNYLSDYIKTIVKEEFSKEDINDEAINIIDSDKLINDMSEKELSKVYSLIYYFFNKSKRKPINLIELFMMYTYKLDNDDAISFIKNNVGNRKLASQILLTSGLSYRSSYYAGRGVRINDLNETHLIAVFKNLLRLDYSYATEFVEMVKKMDSLSAAKFVYTFINFVDNDFKLENMEIEQNNVSLEELSFNEKREYLLSEKIKQSFLTSVEPILMEIQENKEKDTMKGQAKP